MKGEIRSMFAIKPYQRLRAVEYAQKWAYSRSPLFQDYTDFGGDCTNFISQCLLAGSCVMNPLPTFGWYYRSENDYSPSWTGVPFLYNFLTANMEEGPFGDEIPPDSAELGDIVQLGREDGTYYHTLIITGIRDDEILVSAHDNNAYNRALSSYTYSNARFIHIRGVRFLIVENDCCFNGLINGTSIFPDATRREALTCYPAADIPSAPTQEPEDVSPETERPADILPENTPSPTPPTNTDVPPGI